LLSAAAVVVELMLVQVVVAVESLIKPTFPSPRVRLL
jgi:hypothetical protein